MAVDYSERRVNQLTEEWLAEFGNDPAQAGMTAEVFHPGQNLRNESPTNRRDALRLVP